MKGRNFLKAHDYTEIPIIETDQQKGIPPPPFQKVYAKDSKLIDLIPPNELTIGKISFLDCVNHRKSRRGYTKDPLTVEEISFLLWVTQGIREIDTDKLHGAKTTKRTVPSGGSRHPFETYLFINRVEGIDPGIYRYLALEHKLCLLFTDNDLSNKLTTACYEQAFVGKAAVVFLWATIPYRTEWRYGVAAHKDIAIEAGHICQNLYLACESIGAGTCALNAYSQKEIDELLNLDGEDEFIMYIAPVGKIKQRD